MKLIKTVSINGSIFWINPANITLVSLNENEVVEIDFIDGCLVRVDLKEWVRVLSIIQTKERQK